LKDLSSTGKQRNKVRDYGCAGSQMDIEGEECSVKEKKRMPEPKDGTKSYDKERKCNRRSTKPVQRGEEGEKPADQSVKDQKKIQKRSVESRRKEMVGENMQIRRKWVKEVLQGQKDER